MASENLTRVGKIYELERKIGCGSFGEIWLAKNSQTNEEVAVKLESTKVTRFNQANANTTLQLLHEAKLYDTLSGVVGTFPCTNPL